MNASSPRLRNHGGLLLLLCALSGGCLSETSIFPLEFPKISPAVDSVSADSLRLDASSVEPMYTQLLPIDLYTVARLVAAENVDIQVARYEVENAKGGYESAVGAAFPAIVPNAIFQRIDGRNLNSNGNFFNVGFNTFQPSIAIEWLVNPGRVIYEIIAAKKRLHADEHREQAVQQETLRMAANQFYDLVLAQAQVAAAAQAVRESEELLRINQLRSQTGTGVPADELRAEARLAERQQDLANAMNALYKGSLALTRTLMLEDPTVTLVPKLEELPPINLVREDVSIGEMLGFAVKYRPDLQSVRASMDEAEANTDATWWSGFGPQFELAYQYGGVTGHANNIDPGEGLPGNLIVNPLSPAGTFSPNPVANAVTRELIQRGSRRFAHNSDETFKFGQRTEARAGVGTRWSISAFGNLKSAKARREQAALRARQAVLDVKTQVVEATQESKTNKKLIAMAKRQTVSAEEALRLTQANMQAGAMTTLDALQAQDAVAQARLRYAGAVVRYNQAEVNLLAALGLLNENTLSCTNGGSDETQVTMSNAPRTIVKDATGHGEAIRMAEIGR